MNAACHIVQNIIVAKAEEIVCRIESFLENTEMNNKIAGAGEGKELLIY